MQQGLPITVQADGKFSNSLEPLLAKLEMWINYQTLKAHWYENEACHLLFDFKLIRTLDEKQQQLSDENWTVESGYAYFYDIKNQNTQALIVVKDLLQNGVGIEKAIKQRITTVANIIALQHGLTPLP